jgi:adenosylcobinamide kinase/adenosylcobinamide-phosphate guanylyltransferase
LITLLLGGARSGKSTRALALGRRSPRCRVIFLATAQPSDREMRRRISAHRKERPRSWTTIEESRRVPEILARLPRGSTVILDCLTLWIARLLYDRLDSKTVLARVGEACRIAKVRRLNLIAVSNEVGSGVVPPTASGRAYRDLLGAVNATVAAKASRVELMVAGIPVRIKPGR